MTAVETRGSAIGTSVRRKEDASLLRGRGTYVENLMLPGTVFMAVVRSPYPHARIGRVDLTAARAVEGVVAAFTGADLAGRVGQHGAGPPEQRIGGELRVACERADGDAVAVLPHVAQVVEPADVHQRRGARDAELQRGNEGVSAGEEPRVLVAAEEVDRLLHRLGPPVLERGGNHAPALAAASTARTMWSYPVQRQRLPSSARRISPSDGLGFSWSNETVAMTKPGVQ